MSATRSSSAVLSACLILLLFLRSIRATLLTAVSIPLSLIITFVFLYLTGDTLNLMSLGGLAVAIGLIIDDSVVVVENIARHLAAGQSGDEAIDRASREISGAVIGSTLTTILVFLPLAFVRGVVGQFFQSLSLSLTVALLVSMVVSLTVVPVLASRFLANRAMPSSGPIYRVMADVYERVLRLALALAARRSCSWRCWPSCRAGGSIAACTPVSCRKWTRGRSSSTTSCRPELHWPRPTKLHGGSTRFSSETPDVAGYLRRTGAENGIYATEAFRGDIEVALKPPGQRRPMDEIFKSLEEELKAKIPEAKNQARSADPRPDRRSQRHQQPRGSEDLRAGRGQASRVGRTGRQDRRKDGSWTKWTPTSNWEIPIWWSGQTAWPWPASA